jgi:hypothetical protein
MLDWFRAAHAVHIVIAVLGAIGFFVYWRRTRFWLPRYVHYLAAVALVVSLLLMPYTEPDAPVNQGEWIWFKNLLLVLSLPALVYFFFVFYGGQRAAYENAHLPERCQFCGDSYVPAGETCPTCGQIAR